MFWCQESNSRSSSSVTIHKMSTRSLRPRASVDYSAKQDSGTGTPGWLKSKGRVPQSHSKRRQTESAVPQQGKENAGTATGARSSEPHTGNNGKASIPAKDAAGADAEANEQPQQARRGRRNTKKPANVATRGRNADLQVAEVEAPKSTGKRKAAAKSYSGDATGTEQSPAPLQVRKRPKQAKQALAVGEGSAPSAAAAGAAEVLKPVAGLPGVQQRVQARPGRGSGGQLPTSDSPAGKDQTGSGSSKRRRNAAPAAALTAAECIVLDDEDTPAAKRQRGAPEGTNSEAGPSQTLAERLAERAKATAPSAAPPGQPSATAVPPLAPKAAIRAEPASSCPAVAQVPAASQGKAAARPEGGCGAEPAAGQKETASASAAAEDQEMAADAGLDAAMGPGYTLLKAEFDKLQESYRALKAQKVGEVDKAMEGLSKRTEGHVETAARLTEHWKAEAMRQAGFAQAASDMQEELKAVRADRMGLRQEILQLEATMLERDERITDLQQHLNEVTEAMQQPQLEDGAVQVEGLLKAPQQQEASMQFPSPGATAQASRQSQAADSQAGAQSGQRSMLGDPGAAEPVSSHVARAMCPEGVSDHAAAAAKVEGGVAGTPLEANLAGGRVDCRSSARPLVPYQAGYSAGGRVDCRSSAKPLVPYQAGQSAGVLRPRRSQFGPAADIDLKRAMAAIHSPDQGPWLRPGAPTSTAQSMAAGEAGGDQGAASGLAAGQAGQAGGRLAPHLVHAAAVPLPEASPAAPAARQAQPEQRVAPTQLPPAAARLQQVLSPASASPGTTQAAAQLVALSQRRSRGMVGRQLQWPTPRPQLAAVDMSISEPEQEGAAAAGGQDALQALMGLTATPLRGGGFRYTHADSGLVFEIATALNPEHGVPANLNAMEHEMIFRPLHMGAATDALPSYLHDEITFDASQRQMLVGRIMQSLAIVQQRPV